MSHKSETAVHRNPSRWREISAPAQSKTSGADRALRLPEFIGSSGPPDTRLDGLRVGLVGAGSVGGPAALHVARLQPEAIFIVDSARLKPESVLTHMILPADIGQPKASYWGRRCKA